MNKTKLTIMVLRAKLKAEKDLKLHKENWETEDQPVEKEDQWQPQDKNMRDFEVNN